MIVAAIWVVPMHAQGASAEPAVASPELGTAACTGEARATAAPDAQLHKPILLCQRSYCATQGQRCSISGTGPGGCCHYELCVSDPTCVEPDPLPVNICH